MEYDLDRDDEAWLARFNGDQERMTHRRLEELLWKLDCANAEATNSVLSAASECCRLQGCKVARPWPSSARCTHSYWHSCMPVLDPVFSVACACHGCTSVPGLAAAERPYVQQHL